MLTANPRNTASHNLSKYRHVEITTGGICGDVLSDEYGDSWQIAHPVSLLKAIVDDPRRAEAVTHVVFTPEDDVSYPDATTDESIIFQELAAPRVIEDIDYTNVKAMVRDFDTHPVGMCDTGLSNEAKEKWRAAINKGESSPLFAIILTLLPNITTLYFYGYGDIYREYLDQV